MIANEDTVFVEEGLISDEITWRDIVEVLAMIEDVVNLT